MEDFMKEPFDASVKMRQTDTQNLIRPMTRHSP